MAVELSSGIVVAVPAEQIPRGTGTVRRRPTEESAHFSMAGDLKFRADEAYQPAAAQHHVLQVTLKKKN